MEVDADARFLCIHQAVEGARVGPADYTFRHGPDVVRGRDIPTGPSAVLAGHIHRAQVLTHDLSGRPLAAPVIYPGSIERTSFAERDEEKGYTLVTASLSGPRPVDPLFVPLPSRPMVKLTLDTGDLDREGLLARVRAELTDIDPQAIVRVQLEGPRSQEAAELLTAACLRDLAPASMNISLSIPRLRFASRQKRSAKH